MHLRFEGKLRGAEGVVVGDQDVEWERPAGVRASVGAVDDHLPVEQIRHRRRAGPAERRRVDPQPVQLFPDARSEARLRPRRGRPSGRGAGWRRWCSAHPPESFRFAASGL